jgi:hypothetical protein
MTDFNPNARDRADFFSPIQVETFFTRVESYLTSFLATSVRIRGIDLSHWNGKVDFEKVKSSGIDFVILKATEGDGFLDKTFDYNWRSSLDNDLVVMPYHFFRSNIKGNPQVEWFFRQENGGEFVEEVEGKTLLWWDVETEDSTGVTARQNRLFGACTNTVSKGLQTGYYSSYSKWGSLIGNPVWTNDFWQWPAHWTAADYPTLPIGWTKEKSIIWQNGIYPNYPWVETVEGVPSSVDHNYFFGTLQELRDLLGLTVPLPDCCERVAQIERELVIIKSRIAQGELNDIEYKNELEILRWGEVALDERLSTIETKLIQVSDILE